MHWHALDAINKGALEATHKLFCFKILRCIAMHGVDATNMGALCAAAGPRAKALLVFCKNLKVNFYRCTFAVVVAAAAAAVKAPVPHLCVSLSIPEDRIPVHVCVAKLTSCYAADSGMLCRLELLFAAINFGIFQPAKANFLMAGLYPAILGTSSGPSSLEEGCHLVSLVLVLVSQPSWMGRRESSHAGHVGDGRQEGSHAGQDVQDLILLPLQWVSMIPALAPAAPVAGAHAWATCVH
eukprot:scaffold180149_cov15-Tisochrysis_lutea.AAC.1